MACTSTDYITPRQKPQHHFQALTRTSFQQRVPRTESQGPQPIAGHAAAGQTPSRGAPSMPRHLELLVNIPSQGAGGASCVNTESAKPPGDPHTTGAMWETGAGGQATAASNGQGRQGGLTKDRRRAGRAPKTSGQDTKLQRQHSESAD